MCISTNSFKYFFWGIRTLTNTSDAVIDYYGTSKTTRIIYTIVTNTFLLSYEGNLALNTLTFSDPLTLKLNFLQLFNSSLNCTCFIFNMIIGLDCNNQLPSILKHICNYDTAASFQKKTCHPKMNGFRIAILILITISTLILSMRFQNNQSFFSLLATIFYVEFFMQIFSFCGLLLSVYQRFYHLNQLVLTTGICSNHMS